MRWTNSDGAPRLRLVATRKLDFILYVLANLLQIIKFVKVLMVFAAV